MFSSTFYSTMDALGNRHQMPSFEIFCDRLTHKQSKITQMDSLTGSQSQALLAKDTQEQKTKRILDSSSQHSTSPSSSSKKDKKKTKIPTCSYCQKGPHDESHYFQKRFDGYEKQIVDLQALLQKSIVSSPSSFTSQRSSSSSLTLHQILERVMHYGNPLHPLYRSLRYWTQVLLTI